MDKEGVKKYYLMTALYYAVGLAGAFCVYDVIWGMSRFENVSAIAGIGCLFLGMLLFACRVNLRYRGVGRNMPFSRAVDFFPLEVVLAVAFAGFMCVMAIAAFVLDNSTNDGFVIPVYSGAGILFFVDLVFGTIASRIGEKRFSDSLLIAWLGKKFLKVAKAFCKAFPQLSGLEKICAALMGVQVVILFFVAGCADNVIELAVLIFILTVDIDAFVLFALIQMRGVKKNLQAVAAGEYERHEEKKYMLPQIREYMDIINDIGEGQKAAAERLLKSERMKTELITNVSHDLRTPLTSIVNYVDLLDREKLDNEKAAEYIEVLKRQSAKLKKLTEDLIEVSKASSGNIEMKLEECDVSVLIGQAEGEFSDKLKARDLKLEISGTDKPVNVTADGRYLWRVFDNLLSNISKYALRGSRVYIDVVQAEDHTSVIFKNISEEKLNITADELMERFVRGDSSRSTEGSGLGLSIADSLMKMMKGALVITVDGDLFKAECRF